MGEIHQQQQKMMSEAVTPSPIFNLQYNYQQIFQQVENLPTTHELLFHYQPHRQGYLQQQPQQLYQRRLQDDQQSTVSSLTAGFPIDFKPEDLNGNGREDDVTVRESEGYVPETRCSALAMSHSWHNQEDSAIRQPFWKHFCTEISGRRNKRGIEARDKEEQPEMNQNEDYDEEETEQNSCKGSRLFGELEAICGHTTAIVKSNQTGSGSSLNNNGEGLAHHPNSKAIMVLARFGHDHSSETSSRMVQKNKKNKKKRKKMKDEMGSMAHFFESLVKQLMNHQEVLYKKFVEMIEKIDKEREEREEAWRRQELDKLQLEVAAKAHERALASTREASIIAHLEKLTGQAIKLPPREISVGNVNEVSNSNYRNRNNVESVMSKRWPKAEVEALIQIRSRLEQRFQEPGLKGPLWEEISNSMSSMGFQRNAKRCKEKWENINKYFKKSKENPKDRRQKLKTCEYFDQLDKLYSKSIISNSSFSADHQLLHSGNKLELPSNKLQETPNIRKGELKKSYMDIEQEIHTKKTDKHGAIADIGRVELLK